MKFPMGRPLWIHKNHHSSCKTVWSLYDSIAPLIFQLFACFVNKAILRSFGSTNLLLQRPPVSHGFIHQKSLHLGKRLTYALSLLALHSPLCRCSRLCCSYFSTLSLQSRARHLLKPGRQDPAPSAVLFALSTDYYNNKSSSCLKQISSQQSGEK